MVLYDLINELKEKYMFNENIKDFDLILQKKDEHHTLTCVFKDTYGIKNKSVTFISSIEDCGEERIKKWVSTLINGVTCVKQLNDKLRDIYDDRDGVHIYFRYSLKNEFKSYVYDWDYDTILISLSRKSIQQLCSLNEDLDISSDNVIIYHDIEDFILNYKQSNIASAINLEIDSSNVYEALSKHMNDRETVINAIRDSKNQHNKIEITSVLASESLGIVCKFKWSVDFDALDIKVGIENNKLYSVKNKEFIRDGEILSGIEKLYKLTAHEITEIFS